jgi:hypothetical protein
MKMTAIQTTDRGLKLTLMIVGGLSGTKVRSTDSHLLTSNIWLECLLRFPAHRPGYAPTDRLGHYNRGSGVDVAIAGFRSFLDFFLPDEFDRERPEFQRLTEDEFMVDGSVPIHEISACRSL